MSCGDVEATLRRWRADRLSFIGDLVLDDGRPLAEALTPWQRAMLDGIHRHRYAYCELPRGSGKTTVLAAELTAELFLGRPSSRIYAAASDRDQAAILHELAAGFIERSPILSQSAEIERWRILIPSTRSRLEVLAADAPSALGLQPDYIVCDELAVWPDPELWFALVTAAGKRSAKVVVISTPGADLAHFSKAVRDHAAQGGPWFYFHRSEPAEWVSAEYLAEMKRTLPPEVYARYFEARWVQGGGRPITEEDLQAVFDPHLRSRTHGEPGRVYVAGLDIGLVADRTVLAVLHFDDGGTVVADRLEVWQGSREQRVLFADLDEALRRIHRDFYAPVVVVDPWQALKLVEDLKRAGVRFEEAKFTAEYRHRIDHTLLRLIKDRQFRCFAGTPEADLLRQEMLTLEMEPKPQGWRMQHRPGQHDDAWTAVAMAATCAVANAGTQLTLDPQAMWELAAFGTRPNPWTGEQTPLPPPPDRRTQEPDGLEVWSLPDRQPWPW